MRSQLIGAVMAESAVLASTPALAQVVGERPEYWHHGGEGGHMMFGLIMMILLVIGVGLVVALVIRWLGGSSARQGGRSQTNKDALDVLRERFARGEIEKEEFEDRRRLLSQ